MIQKLNNFQQRFLMSLLGIVFLTSVIFFSHTPPFDHLFVGAVGIVQAIALWEYYNLAEKKGIEPLKALGIIFSLLFVLFHRDFLPIVLFTFVALCFIFHFAKPTNAIVNSAASLFGFIYVTIPLCFLIDLNSGQTSLWIVYLLICTKITDTAAYIAGKTLGSHLLAPTLSPKKTKEGAIAGVAFAALTSLLFFAIANVLGYKEFSHFSWLEMAILGLLIGIVSQIGDLAESLLKRDAQVKDSSTLPGFGGMLDIVDSLLFTSPLLFVWLKAKNLL